MDKVQNAAGQARGEIGAEVERAVFLDTPREVHARIFFRRREFDVRIGLVVAEHNVELGAILLDEVILERQGFAFVAYDNGFEISNLPRQRTGLGIDPARFEEVGTHAAAQVARLADV